MNTLNTADIVAMYEQMYNRLRAIYERQQEELNNTGHQLVWTCLAAMKKEMHS